MRQNNVYIQSLKKAGYRLTQARLTVLEVLETEHGHITSADVLERVERINPAIGRASVFRTLELFTQLGFIRPTYIHTSSTPTYVMMHGGRHHHVICTECKSFFELDDYGLEVMTRNVQRELDIQISGHLLEFFGVCGDCLNPDGAEQPS